MALPCHLPHTTPVLCWGLTTESRHHPHGGQLPSLAVLSKSPQLFSSISLAKAKSMGRLCPGEAEWE